MDPFSTIYLLTPAAIGPFITLIAVAVMATAIYSKRTHTRLGQTIVLLTIPIIAALFFHTLATMTPYYGTDRIWVQGWLLAYLFVPPALLIYTNSLSKPHLKTPYLHPVDIIMSVAGLTLFFEGFLLKPVYLAHAWSYVPAASTWLLVYGGYFFIRLVIILSHISRTALGNSNEEKASHSPNVSQRKRLWFFATSTALLFPIVDVFAMLGISVYPFGFLGYLVLYTLLLFGSSQFFFLEMNVTLAADRIIHTMPDPLLVCDQSGFIKIVNDAFSSVFGYEPENLINRKLSNCPNYEQMGSLIGVMKSKNNGSIETSLYDRDNNLFPAHISASRLINRDGSISGTIFVIQDVREYRRIMNEIEALYHKTEEEVEQRTKELQEANCSLKAEIARREQIEEKLRHTAFHDGLTGLPNRELFSEHLQHAFNKYKHRGGITFAILFIDLDHFKFVNDTYGHIVGDFVLKETAQRLHDCMRDVDTVGRLGGDEFVILMDDISEPSQTIKVAERILDSMQDVIAFNGTEIKLGCSIGIAFAEQRHEAPKEIIRDADIALYHAKQQGKHRYSIFQGELQERAIRHMKIEHELRETVRQGEFDIQYQPIVKLSKGELKGFEALIRWNSNELGQISPETFIPIAEESELIFEIGRWVLYRACNDMSNWLQHLPQHLQSTTISVNVSPRQLQSPEILRDVKNALGESMLPPQNLVIEVTESAIITDANGALQTLNQLKEMGVKLHLDDFGEGYSSLSMLYRFPFDTMKIDRSYVSGLHTNHDNSEVVRTIINLGHSMKKEVIAEGIETSVEATALRNFKCELGQGFFFSKPMDEEKALTFIKSI
jgi:diguanylate cyclase (GGDEF)-like protein/PAS domain S-box-containing protein